MRKFDSIELSFVDSYLSTSTESPLKKSHLNNRYYNIGCSDDSFISLEFPISISENEKNFKISFREDPFEDFEMNKFDDFDHILSF